MGLSEGWAPFMKQPSTPAKRAGGSRQSGGELIAGDWVLGVRQAVGSERPGERAGPSKEVSQSAVTRYVLSYPPRRTGHAPR